MRGGEGVMCVQGGEGVTCVRGGEGVTCEHMLVRIERYYNS